MHIYNLFTATNIIFNLERKIVITIKKVSATESAITKTTAATAEKRIDMETAQTEIGTTADRIEMRRIDGQEIDPASGREVVRRDLGLIVGLNLVRGLKNVRDIHMVIIKPVTHPLFVIVRDERKTRLAT